jgi:hypothetical protein
VKLIQSYKRRSTSKTLIADGAYSVDWNGRDGKVESVNIRVADEAQPPFRLCGTIEEMEDLANRLLDSIVRARHYEQENQP